MADENSQSLRESSSSMSGALSGFIGARAELALIEAREAASFVGKKTGIGLLFCFCLFFTWALILAGLAGICAPLFNKLLSNHAAWVPGWTLVVFLFAILHVVIAIICAAKLKKKPKEQLFELSRREIQNDKQWLSNSK